MSSAGSEGSGVEYVEDVVAEKFQDLPASSPSKGAEEPPHAPRLFNRQRSLHQLLGGGKVPSEARGEASRWIRLRAKAMRGLLAHLVLRSLPHYWGWRGYLAFQASCLAFPCSSVMRASVHGVLGLIWIWHFFMLLEAFLFFLFSAADTLLWRDKFMSAGILAGATVTYLVLEHSGYTLLTILANLLLVTFAVLFVWSNAAVFLNRSPPPLPDLRISEDEAKRLALALREEINKVLAAAHDIALGKDFKLFLKVAVVLWGLSVVGGWFHFLTLVYLVVVVSHTIPATYERYEDQIEFYAKRAFEEAHNQYRKVDATILSKLPKGVPKMKKTE